MMRIPVFWMEPTGMQRVSLRRYAEIPAGGVPCPANPGKYSYHDVRAVVGEAPVVFTESDGEKVMEALAPVPHEDPRWPRACSCGFVFAETHSWQVFGEVLYSGAPDRQSHTLRDMPVGALWDAWWLERHPHGPGPDGISLMCETPGGAWHIDGECSNCTRPQREVREGRTFLTDRTHYCWVRHGDPKAPSTLHVDKEGNTCAAGAGSIQIGGWHGFLHHGHLVVA